MNRIVILLLIIMASVYPLQAKSYLSNVGVFVYPNFGETKISLMELIESHTKEEIKALDELKKALTNPSIGGSIFDSNGQYYLVTSAFPLYYANSVDIVLVINGKREQYRKLPIVSLEKNLGLALIDISSIKLSPDRIETLEMALSDQQEVIVREGTGNEQKGLIKGSSKRVSSLAQVTLIEHTVNIRYQQSGSPLLVTNSEGIYSFVAINIYNTNESVMSGYSVPLSVVERLIESYQERTDSNDEAILTSRAKALIVELNKKNGARSSPYISLLLSQRWANRWLEVNLRGSNSDAILWQEKLMLLSPDRLYKELMATLLFKNELYEFRNIVSISRNHTVEPSLIAFYLADQIIITSWLKIFGQWQLIALPNNFIDENLLQGDFKKKGQDQSIKLRQNGLSVGAGSLVGNYSPLTLQIGYSLTPVNFFSFAFMLNYDSMEYSVLESRFYAKLLTPSVGTRLQLPIKGSAVSIIPFFGFHIGMPITLSHSFPDASYYNEMLLVRNRLGLNLGWNGGLEIGFGRDPFIYLGGEMGYTQDFFTTRYLTSSGSKASTYYGRSFIKFAFR